MGVLTGRALKFSKVDEGVYDVAAVSTGYTLRPLHVSLGQVRRDRRSTDSKIAGTRFRRQGKGATVWRAVVPSEQFDHPRNSRTGERIRTAPKYAGELMGCFGGGYRVESRGETWDRREEAALALVAWYDGDRSTD